jgi:hypothetical protein
MKIRYFILKTLFSLFLITPFTTFAQDSLAVKSTAPAFESMIKIVSFSPGILVQHQVFGEANVLVGSAIKNKMIIGVTGLRFGVESNFKSGNEHILGLKAGAEIDVLVFAMRASVIEYFNGSRSQLRLLPEFGITFGGLYTLTYGYGMKLTDTDIPGISHHRLSLSINMGRKLHRFINGY